MLLNVNVISFNHNLFILMYADGIYHMRFILLVLSLEQKEAPLCIRYLREEINKKKFI